MTNQKQRTVTANYKCRYYLKGWSHGAGMLPIPPECNGNEFYELGFLDGKNARREALNNYAKSVGAIINIVRAV